MSSVFCFTYRLFLMIWENWFNLATRHWKTSWPLTCLVSTPFCHHTWKLLCHQICSFLWLGKQLLRVMPFYMNFTHALQYVYCVINARQRYNNSPYIYDCQNSSHSYDSVTHWSKTDPIPPFVPTCWHQKDHFHATNLVYVPRQKNLS